MSQVDDPILDAKYMERCLLLAMQADGRTAPNPIVGSLVVDKKGEVVAEGYHTRAGQPHAEVMALHAAGSRAYGSTLYVNLEPCCHHGRTGPCVDQIIHSGVARVVVGIEDPNPKVRGGGIRALRARGIQVDVGILQEECAWANRAFISSISRGRPWVCLKMASTLDGKIADRNGMSKWISGPDARQHVQELRNLYNCVLIGAETARRDDPELTVRSVEGGRNPHRAVIDPMITVPRNARIFTAHGDNSRTFLFCGKRTDIFPKIKELPDSVAVLRVSELANEPGKLDLAEVLKSLVAQEVNSVLCEGGGTLAAALLSAGLVDEVHWIMAPKLLNDSEAIPSLRLSNDISLPSALKLERMRVSQLGDDVLIEGTVGMPEFLVPQVAQASALE